MGCDLGWTRCFDARTDRFTTFSADPHAREMIYLAMAEDPQHDLWLGTNGFGLKHFNPKTTQFTTIVSSDALGSLSDSEVNWVHVARTGCSVGGHVKRPERVRSGDKTFHCL